MTKPTLGVEQGTTTRRAGAWQATLLLAGSCMPVMGSVLITPVLPQLSAHFADEPGADVLVPMSEDELSGLNRVREALEGTLGDELRTMLSRLEVRATVRRVDELLAAGRFPVPSPSWPAIPWPPF